MKYVREVMTSNPKTCRVDSNLVDCLALMRDENCGLIPLVDDSNHLTGVITDRDAALCMLTHPDTPPRQIRIEACASHKPMITCRPGDNLQDAMSRMEEHQVRRIPVVDEQMRVVGIVSQADIALKNQSTQEVGEMVKEVSQERQSVGANP